MKTILLYFLIFVPKLIFGQLSLYTDEKETGYLLDNQKHGVWITYYPDSKNVYSEIEYSKGIPNGSFKSYWENGQLKDSGKRIDKNFIDTLKLFYPNGNLFYKAYYNENFKEEGEVYFYESDGKVSYSYSAKNGEFQKVTYKTLNPLLSIVDSSYNTINCKDDFGKYGHWIVLGKDRPESGIPLDKKVEEGTYFNDKKVGKWIKYHNDGVHVKLIGFFSNGRPSGPYWKYHSNGNLKEQSVFSKNNYIDTLYRYSTNGKIESISYDDKLNEIVIKFKEDGTSDTTVINPACILTEPIRKPQNLTPYSIEYLSYINKKTEKGKQGDWAYFGKDYPGLMKSDSLLVETGQYENDKRVGTWVFYAKDGKSIEFMCDYKNGLPVKYINNDSMTYFYYPSDTLFKTDSSEVHFFPNGQIKAYYLSQTKKWKYYDEAGNGIEKLLLKSNYIYKKEDQTRFIVKRNQPFKKDGYNKLFNVADEIWQEGIYKNGYLWDGKVHVYDRDYILLKVKIYKDGKYFADGQL